jgi:DNA-binding transcriptional MerR regulator
MDDRMLIGRFARLSGVGIGALRHYHELGLLIPARVDPATGYRYYRRDQAEDARLIARLRELDVSLPEIRAILGSDANGRRARLSAHRARVMVELTRLQRAVHHLNRIVDHEEEIVTPSAPTSNMDPDARRTLAADLFNHVWTLLETSDRTPSQDDEMLHAAHASRFHWGEVETGARLARGEWQCSRVYAVLGRAEPALHHARRCMEICREEGIGDFDMAFAHEALARANRVAGDHEAAEDHLRLARAAADDVADEEDRALVLSDLATIGG